MIDMHSHVDLYPDVFEILDKINLKNKFTLAVTTSPRAWIATSKILKKYTNIHVALGLHPEIIESKLQEESLLLDMIKQTRYIGEIGIDGTKAHRHTLLLQENIFTKILNECQKEGNKIVSIHSRGAVKRVLDIIEKYPSGGKYILHWFSGTEKQLERAKELGCWFSVNSKMFNSKKGLLLIAKIPMNRLLPESDGPFAQINQKTIYPWEAMNFITKLGKICNIEENKVTLLIKDNLNELLKHK